jgi:hypothetical protein
MSIGTEPFSIGLSNFCASNIAKIVCGNSLRTRPFGSDRAYRLNLIGPWSEKAESSFERSLGERYADFLGHLEGPDSRAQMTFGPGTFSVARGLLGHRE